jgi:hypothetical protein
MDPLKINPAAVKTSEQILQKQLAASAEAAQNNIQDKLQKDKEIAPQKEYYTHTPGCFYVFKDGSKATFTGGVYATDKPSEIEELDAVCAMKDQHLITHEPQEVKVSDAKIMREVGKGPQNGGGVTGMVNSTNVMPR